MHPLKHVETMLTQVSQSLNIAKDLTQAKIVQLQPWGGFAVLYPDGSWKLRSPYARLQPDAIVSWKPEQWAQWVKGALAGHWSFSFQEGFAVEGDIAWVLFLQRQFRLLPWWWNSTSKSYTYLPSPFTIFTYFASQPITHLVNAGSDLIRDALLEDHYGISHHHIDALKQEIQALHDAVERLEARCLLLEKTPNFSSIPLSVSSQPSLES